MIPANFEYVRPSSVDEAVGAVRNARRLDRRAEARACLVAAGVSHEAGKRPYRRFLASARHAAPPTRPNSN